MHSGFPSPPSSSLTLTPGRVKLGQGVLFEQIDHDIPHGGGNGGEPATNHHTDESSSQVRPV